MSAVSESIAQRVTLGMLVERYGFEVDPPFATNVTITSLSDAVDTVIPGSLFICTHEQEPDVLHAAQAGAYAALLPRASKGQIANADIPLLYGDFDDRVLGDLASGLAGGPSNAMAVFAVTGADEQAVDAGVSQLSEFLHMLGNPVAVITASGSTSMTRTMNLNYPLGILDMQRALSVCAEDGVAAVIIAMDDRTLAEHALESVNVDVLGTEDVNASASLNELKTRYAFVAEHDMSMTSSTPESDEMAADSPAMYDRVRLGHMSLAIAMVLAPSSHLASVFLVALTTWFPLSVNLSGGIRGVHKVYIERAQIMGASPFRIITRVIYTAVLPNIFTGLFMGLCFSMTSLVGAETLGVQAGLGWVINYAQGWNEFDLIFSTIIIFVLMAFVLLTILFKCQKHVMKWSKGAIQW